MARFVGDQNRLTFAYESGTYANPTGTTLQWVGLVTSHELDENPNVLEIRYANTGNRNVGLFVDGPLDYEGTFTFHPQQWEMMVFALGSNVDGGSPSPYSHTISEVNSASGNAFTSGTLLPFMSFTIEDWKQGPVTGENFGRRVQGCIVNSLAINGAEGEPLSVEVNYFAQSGTFLSGALPTIEADPGTVPFLWQHCQIHIPSGTIYNEVKEFSWNINNNLERRHYLNGSRVASIPVPLNRDYEFSVTLDATSERTNTLYNQYFLGGSTFNAMLSIIASTGSREMFLVMSGCKMLDMTSSSPMEGVQEQTLTIKPQTCSAVVSDTTQYLNPWNPT